MKLYRAYVSLERAVQLKNKYVIEESLERLLSDYYEQNIFSVKGRNKKTKIVGQLTGLMNTVSRVLNCVSQTGTTDICMLIFYRVNSFITEVVTKRQIDSDSIVWDKKLLLFLLEKILYDKDISVLQLDTDTVFGPLIGSVDMEQLIDLNAKIRQIPPHLEVKSALPLLKWFSDHLKSHVLGFDSFFVCALGMADIPLLLWLDEVYSLSELVDVVRMRYLHLPYVYQGVFFKKITREFHNILLQRTSIVDDIETFYINEHIIRNDCESIEWIMDLQPPRSLIYDQKAILFALDKDYYEVLNLLKQRDEKYLLPVMNKAITISTFLPLSTEDPVLAIRKMVKNSKIFTVNSSCKYGDCFFFSNTTIYQKLKYDTRASSWLDSLNYSYVGSLSVAYRFDMLWTISDRDSYISSLVGDRLRDLYDLIIELGDEFHLGLLYPPLSPFVPDKNIRQQFILCRFLQHTASQQNLNGKPGKIFCRENIDTRNIIWYTKADKNVVISMTYWYWINKKCMLIDLLALHVFFDKDWLLARKTYMELTREEYWNYVNDKRNSSIPKEYYEILHLIGKEVIIKSDAKLLLLSKDIVVD